MAVARKFEVENQLRVSPDQVVVSCGAKYSLFQILQCIVEPGDEVLLLSPYWFAYPMQVTLAGGVPVILPTREEQRFHPDVDAIRAAVTGATKAIVINSPCNPTGAVYRREVLAELAHLAVERDLLVIADEVYEKMLYDGAEHVSIGSLNAEIASRTATVNSVSKTHSMTGWRIGYAALPGKLAEEVTELQSYSTSGPCAIAQRAALAALTNDSSHVVAMVTEYAERRRYLLDRLAPLVAGLHRSPTPQLDRFPTVQHLATPITGTSAARLLELAGALHPTAAVGGSPRGAAIRLIGELEQIERGWYAGGIGWTDATGDGEIAVTLRCALVRGKLLGKYRLVRKVAAGGYGETVRDPAEIMPALKRGLAQTRNGKPAVISVWLKRLEGED